jgi:hypothetical protein
VKNVLSLVAILLLGWGVKFGFNMITAEPYLEPSAEEWAAEVDGWVDESLADGTAAEARGWFRNENHVSFEGDPKQMNDVIEDLYASGAERVWMIDIVDFGGKRISDTLAAELPSAPSGRARVFAAEARLWGGESTEDVGQRYLTVSFD